MRNTFVSLFKGYSDTVPTRVALGDVFRLLTSDASVKDRTEKHRFYLSQGQKTAAAREKSSCPCFAVAVRFEGGKQKADICAWTGLCLADFDHIPAERMAEVTGLVRADRHTLMAYTTVSGMGLRVIFRITLPEGGSCEAAYREAFMQGNGYYAKLIGLDYDRACKNPTRLSGLAADPEAFLNPDAEPFPVPEVKPKPKRAVRNFRLERAVTLTRAELEGEGVVYREHHRNEYIMRTGYLLNAYGIPQDEAVAWAVEKFADYGGDVAGIFRSCYAQTDEHGTRLLYKNLRRKRQEQSRIASVDEIEAFLDGQGEFRHNVVTGKYEMRFPEEDDYAEMTDRAMNSLWRRMSKEGANVRLCDLRTVIESEYVPVFNPFSAYFSALPKWDGTTDHIARLAATVHVEGDQEAFAGAFRKWLVGVVASMLCTEVVNHEILVLVGPQGIYKTTWFHRLLPEGLRRYFNLKSNCSSFGKDDFLSLSEFALVCLEEIDELRTPEMNRLKAMISMPQVNERRAYGHYKEQRPHMASFCGTTNNPQFLNDPTGSRRWLPFMVKTIDNPHRHPVDYEHVYSQAYALWKGGFHYWFEDEEIRAINARNSDFEVACLETDLVLSYFRVPLPGEECVFLTMGEIYERFGSAVQGRFSLSRLGLAMKKAGFKACRAGGKRGYRVVEYTVEQVRLNRQAMGRIVASDAFTASPQPSSEERELPLDY